MSKRVECVGGIVNIVLGKPYTFVRDADNKLCAVELRKEAILPYNVTPVEQKYSAEECYQIEERMPEYREDRSLCCCAIL